MAKKPDRIPAVMAVMTPFPWFIQLDDRLDHALEVMELHEIRHLPVTDEGTLVGLVTQRDVSGLLSGLSEAERATRQVGSATVEEAYVVDVSTPLDAVLLEMAGRHIGSALVTKAGRLAGIFTATDACRAFGEFLQACFPSDPSGRAA